MKSHYISKTILASAAFIALNHQQAHAIRLDELLEGVRKNISKFLAAPDASNFSKTCKANHKVVTTSTAWKFLRDNGLRPKKDVPMGLVVERKLALLDFKIAEEAGDEKTAENFLQKALELGDLKAIEIKFNRLFKKDSEQEPTTTTAKDFLEEWIERGSRKALEMKRDNLNGGHNLYENNQEEAAKINDLLIEQGSVEALRYKRNAVRAGINGYEQNDDEWKKITEQFIKLGDHEAIIDKLHDVIADDGRYPFDIKVIDSLLGLLGNVVAEDEHKVSNDLDHLIGFENPTEENLNAMRLLNEWLLEKGDDDAKRTKFGGLLFGQYGYDKDTEAAVLFWLSNNPSLDVGELYSALNSMPPGLELEEINKVVEKWYPKEGLKHKLKRLDNENPEEAVKMNDQLAELGFYLGHRRKLIGIIEGKHGYTKNPEAVSEYISEIKKKVYGANEKLMQFVQRLEIKGLAEGVFGYEKNPKEAKKRNEDLIQKNDPAAIGRKSEGYHKAKHGYEEKTPLAARLVLDRGILESDRKSDPNWKTNETRELMLKKASGFRKGKYGFPMNLIAAYKLAKLVAEDKPYKKFIQWEIENLKKGSKDFEQDKATAEALEAMLKETEAGAKFLNLIDTKSDENFYQASEFIFEHSAFLSDPSDLVQALHFLPRVKETESLRKNILEKLISLSPDVKLMEWAVDSFLLSDPVAAYQFARAMMFVPDDLK